MNLCTMVHIEKTEANDIQFRGQTFNSLWLIWSCNLCFILWKKRDRVYKKRPFHDKKLQPTVLFFRYRYPLILQAPPLCRGLVKKSWLHLGISLCRKNSARSQSDSRDSSRSKYRIDSDSTTSKHVYIYRKYNIMDIRIFFRDETIEWFFNAAWKIDFW